MTVPEDHNSLVARLQEHTWVSVSTDTRQLVRNQSLDPLIVFTLKLGTYVARTDGKIESVTTENFCQDPSIFEQLRQGTPMLLTLTEQKGKPLVRPISIYTSSFTSGRRAKEEQRGQVFDLGEIILLYDIQHHQQYP